MRRELVSGLVLVAIACLCGSAVATDYFVATDGDDSWPGTISQPFRTITKGTSVAVAGDTINVRAGSYAESRLDFYSDGTAGNPITLLSYDGDHAAHITDGIYVHARGYIDIIGMQVSGSTYNLHIDPGDGLTPRSQYINVIRCYSHDSEGTPGCCVKANQSDYVILEDCEIGGTSDKCLDWVWVTYSEVRRNYWHDYLDYGLMNKGGSMYGIVEDTVVVNALDSVTKALKFGGTTDKKYRNPDSDYATQYTVYRNNIIRECEGGATCTYECWYAYFYHNTVHNCGAEPGRGIVVHHADRPTTGDGGSRNLFFYNNIFMDTDGDMGEVYEDQSGKPYENWQHDYNNYWNAGNPIPSSGLFDPNLEPNSTFGNPNLANPTGTATTRAGWLSWERTGRRSSRCFAGRR